MLLLIGGLVAVALLVVSGLLASVPAFYRGRVSLQNGLAEQQARRLITKVSALHAGLQRPGRFEAAVTEAEINAWLATDLPANHAAFLPAGWAEPRIELSPHRCRVGARVSWGPCSSVLWINARVQLREVNKISIAIDEARLGAVPLPHGPILGWFSRRLSGLGMLPELRRLDGRTVLVVYIPPSDGAEATTLRRLEALAVGAGELLLSGETRSGGAVAR